MRTFVAIDLPDVAAAADLSARLAPRIGLLKLGLELFSAAGPAGFRQVARHAPVFLDLETGETSGVRVAATPENAIRLLPPAPVMPAILAPTPTLVEVPAVVTPETTPTTTNAKPQATGSNSSNKNNKSNKKSKSRQ